MGIFFDIKWDEFDRDLDRMAHLPGTEARKLDVALGVAFTASQEDVHVRTGSLRNSAKQHSRFSQSEWVGTVSYGGLSPGSVHENVDYAAYEYEKGGAHDFFRGVGAAHESYVEAIYAMLSGDEF